LSAIISRPSRWLTIALTGLSLPAASQPAEQTQPPDPRVKLVENYFRAANSPVHRYAAEFIAAADKFHLDFRLLPGIAMIESGGGKILQGRNVLGWQSGRARFHSVSECIFKVAERFANAPHFAGKDAEAILKSYNPGHPAYVKRVVEAMRRIAPD
jgi:hypothetical protein